MRVTRALLCGALTIGALMSPAGIAQADPPDTARPTVQVTEESVDPAASITPELAQYLATLRPADRKAFERRNLPAKITLEVEAPQPADAEARASQAASGGDVSVQATGCWTSRYTRRATATFGNTLYTYYTVGGWCSSNTTVYRAWLADAGGETSTPGWRYEGVSRTGSGVVSNQGRAWSQHRFVLGSGGIDVQSPTPCARVRGYYNVSVVGDGTCGIY